jgi:hypothetical protein
MLSADLQEFRVCPRQPTERSTPPAQGSDDYPGAKSSPMQKRRCYQRRSGALKRVEPAQLDWHWRERPALALLAWEALLAIR